MLYNYYVDVYFVYEINVYINVYNIHCTMHIGQSRGGDILPQEFLSNSSFAHSCASTSERSLASLVENETTTIPFSSYRC